MTRELYRLLLRLYPRHIRDEFGDEMLAVFSAAAHDGGGLWFLLRECLGAVHGAARERTFAPALGPAIAGVAIAAALHWMLYSWLGRLLSTAATRLSGPLVHEDVLELAVMGLFALLFLIPLIVLLGREIQRDIERKRLRPTR